MGMPVHLQRYLDYKQKGTLPDTETLKNIEESKLIFFTKLFAATAQIDGEVTEDERSYILEFYWMNYPDSIAFYLFDRFNDYVNQNLTLKNFKQSRYDDISYGEKLFILFKILEFLDIQNISRLKTETGRKVSEILGIEKYDFEMAKEIYLTGTISPEKYTNTKMKFLYISDEKENSDVFMPFEGIRTVLFNDGNFFFMVKTDSLSLISTGNYMLRPMTAVSLIYGSNFRINDYFIESEDIKLYLKIKYNLYPDKEFYVNSMPEEIVLEKQKKGFSIAKILMKGCKIIITPLDKSTAISVNERECKCETYVNVNDFVKINDSFVNLRKLKYQEYFDNEYIRLDSLRDEYVLSNKSGADIYINDASESFWESRITLNDGKHYLNTGNCPHPVWIIRDNIDFQINRQSGIFGRSVKKKKRFKLKNGDIIFIQGNVLKLNFEAGLFEKTYFRYITYKAEGLEYSFKNKTKIVDGISCEVDHGDLVCIMGPSGAGKSTLLKILCGMIRPQKGTIHTDNFDFFEYYEKIKRFISYVPQDDVLFENLTVYENLYYNARLRYPKLNSKSISERVLSVIKEIGLSDKKNLKVGEESERVLSGGERKRLNIGLELLSDSNIYFFDEPTTGLSSKDSEKVIELLKKLAVKGKIIFAVIHQPGYKIYNKFNKALILDQGGKLAFYGTTYNAIQYFRQYNRYNSYFSDMSIGKNDPDILLDTLEEPLRDVDGSVLPERKFKPEFWKNKFSGYIKELRPVKIPTKDLVNDVPSKNYDLEGKITQLIILFKRNFINKLRNRSNLIITFLEAPLLAAIVGFILRYIPATDYSLYNNIHLPTFIFLTVIIGMFLAMSNSSDEIIKDTEIIRREKMLDIKFVRYYLSKFTTQMIFASIQNVLYITVSFAFLEMKELHLYYLAFMTIISAVGISFGFLISSIPGLTVKAVQNIVPLILIPQIIFGGALIQYKELNTSLTIYQNSPIPEVCQLMPSRWAYEGLIVMQDTYNSYHSAKDIMQNSLDDHVKSAKKGLTKEDMQKFRTVKERMLECDIADFRRKFMSDYGNMEVHRTVSSGDDRFKMEFEAFSYAYPNMTDTEKHQKVIYPIFTREKMIPLLNTKVNTVVYNALALLLMALMINFAAYWMLSRGDFFRMIFAAFKFRKKRRRQV